MKSEQTCLERNDILIASYNARQPLILVVEENEDNLVLICHVLIYFHHSFIAATNAEAALDIAEKKQPNLILLEPLFSQTNGLELIHDLKHGKFTQNIPIVAVTALARKEHRSAVLAAGCDDYLGKPYYLNDLDRIIRYFLNARHLSKSF